MVNSNLSYLSEGYKPGSTDVVVGRGKKVYNHEGNEKLRCLCFSRMNEYAMTGTRSEKSEILESVVKQVRAGMPSGKFIRKDPNTKLWYDIGNDLAKEKVSQTFRDTLNVFGTSTKDSKNKRHCERRARNKASLKRARIQPLNDYLKEGLHQHSAAYPLQNDHPCSSCEMLVDGNPHKPNDLLRLDSSISDFWPSLPQPQSLCARSNIKNVENAGQLEEIDTSGLLSFGADFASDLNCDNLSAFDMTNEYFDF